MELLFATAVGVLVGAGVYLILRARTFPVVLGLALISYAARPRRLAGPTGQADLFHLFGPLWLCGMLFPAVCLAHPGGKTGLAWALLSWLAGGIKASLCWPGS